MALGFDGLGLDFAEGKQTPALIREHGFPQDKLLFAGVVNGKNIWRNDYEKTLALLNELAAHTGRDRTVISTSCSLLHVPYTLGNETGMEEKYKRHFAFAEEKLDELNDLKLLFGDEGYAGKKIYIDNVRLIRSKERYADKSVGEAVSSLRKEDFLRRPELAEREKLQKAALGLPLLPTTTIGSFPQTSQIKALRSALKKGGMEKAEYERRIKEEIAACIALQEDIGLDVLVHGEFERNDMVEYFGENLEGFLFTQKAWVQSYGTRCVKPPIIWGDIKRTRPITVGYITYAQSLTKRPVKGMLTGPVTILNWSFPREDIQPKETAYQIALAIRSEVLDLEGAGIRIIQIDEAALKEKLPLRRADWHRDYLDWAIVAFRLTHAKVKPVTQIHTHMCYSEFEDIIKEIDAMDADVITFEAARSNLSIVETLSRANFKTAVGPGVYDIHSPRVPAAGEIAQAVKKMLKTIPKGKLWINPDCGLKTRGNEEALASLKNLVCAAENVRRAIDINSKNGL
jgi:5-methyltetrahydropteroyltriglutamate--homocysteine methyltransferase